MTVEHRRRVLVGAVVAASWLAAIAACGVPGSSSFRRTDTDKIPFGLADTTTTTTSTTSTTVLEVIPSTTLEPPPQSVEIPLYFVAGKQLVPIPTPVLFPVSLPQAIFVLEAGPPPGDVAIGVRTAIPTGLNATAQQERGVVTVDLPLEFFEGMSSEDLRFAVAQYVLTLTELTGIGQVKFTQGGVDISVLGGRGELIEAGTPLAHEDYQVLLQAGAPEVTSPTTTVSETTVPLTSVSTP